MDEYEDGKNDTTRNGMNDLPGINYSFIFCTFDLWMTVNYLEELFFTTNKIGFNLAMKKYIPAIYFTILKGRVKVIK